MITISSYLVVLVLGLGYLVLVQGLKDCFKLEYCHCSSDIELNVDRNYSESKVNSFLVLDDYCSIPYLLNNSGFKLNLPVGYRDVQLPFLDLEIPSGSLTLTKYRSTSNMKERYIVVNGNEGSS